MSQADSPNTTTPTRISFTGGVGRRPSPEADIPELPLPTRPMPLAQPIGVWWFPVIYYPERTTEYLRFRRFRRKAKATAEEALAYAERVLWHLERRKAEKRRRLEALEHPRYVMLEAAE